MAETLITSSVIILMLCAIRILFKGRIRPTVQYGLWGIAAARLALPCFYPVIRWFGSLQSPWSIMNAAAPLADRLAVRAHAVTVPSGAVPVNPGQLGAVHAGLENAAANPGTSLISGAEQAGLSGWIVLFFGIWIAGSILLFLWLSVVHIHMGKRLMKQRTPYEGPVPAWSAVPVYWAGDIPTPCYFVYFGKKGIYLPERLQNDPEAARHVVVHEACHAGHRDHIWGWLRCVLLCCYWINPFVWLAGYLSKRDCELSCDEAAVRRLGEAERFAYGRTLIAMAAGRRTPWNFLSTASDIGNGKKSMKERIWTLAHHPKTGPVTALVIAAAAIVLIVCTFTGKMGNGGGAKGAENPEIREQTVLWAEAFCGRNGKELYAMYNPDHRDDFYDMEMVQSEKDDAVISFGMSSPWPMDSVYDIEVDGRNAEVTYYAMTSDPHRWVWKEKLTWVKNGDSWYADQQEFHTYDQVTTAQEFREAYGEALTGGGMDYRTNGLGEGLNRNAQGDPFYEGLLKPETAAEILLNLHSGMGTAAAADGETVVTYTFEKGDSVELTMVQPYGADGIWVPDEVRKDGIREERTEATVDSVPGMAEIVALSELPKDQNLLEAIRKWWPEIPSEDKENETEAELNYVNQYTFSYRGETYRLLVSVLKEDGSLDYASVIREPTGEWLNIYQTPEAVEHYGMVLAGGEETKVFFETHASMADYVTYRLQEGLTDSGYQADLGDGGGGSLFLTEDEDQKARLEELGRYVDRDSVPDAWLAAGGIIRWNADYLYRRFDTGSLMETAIPWNHTTYWGELVSVEDCEVPALLEPLCHDLYTPSSLEEAEKRYGPIPEENQTSRMWYVFFARPDSDVMYAIYLNGDLYKKEDALKLARSVHFKEEAFTP